MLSCPTCGATAPADAAFCPSCGASVEHARQVQRGLASQPAARTPSEARTWATAAHLSALVGGFVGGVGSWVGPLVIWLLKRDDDPFVAEHASEALNFNLLVLLLGVLGIVVATLTLGLGLLAVVPLALLVGVGWLVVTIQAAVRASRGERYRYPFNVRFVR